MTGRHAAGRRQAETIDTTATAQFDAVRNSTQPLEPVSRWRALTARWHNAALAAAGVIAVSTAAVGVYLVSGQPGPRQPSPAPVLSLSPSTTQASRAEEKPHKRSTPPRTPRTRYPAPQPRPTTRRPAPSPSATRTPPETPRPRPTPTPSPTRPSTTPTATPTSGDWPWPPHHRKESPDGN